MHIAQICLNTSRQREIISIKCEIGICMSKKYTAQYNVFERCRIDMIKVKRDMITTGH